LPGLFIAMVPTVMGGETLTYESTTLTTSRTVCWDKIMDWAVEARDRASMFAAAFTEAGGTPPDVRRSLDIWARYNTAATRALRIAWLKRRGCRVVAGQFIPVRTAWAGTGATS
jgi:hypothetical protein